MFAVSGLLNGVSRLVARLLGFSVATAGSTRAAVVDRAAEVLERPVAALVAATLGPVQRAPEVAGYVRRIEVVDRMLAPRLASVAKLNTRVGRTPYSAHTKFDGTTMIPSARIGAKKQRSTTLGLRVLQPSAPKVSAVIIPFPAAATKPDVIATQAA